jgi:predicted O-methyltransferase YrrM
MVTVLEEILASSTVQSGDGHELELKDHITPEEGRFLQRLVGEVQPQTSLEVGLACGISALYICDALPADARHVVVDAFQAELFENAGLRSLERAGHRDRVDFHEERSQFALPRLVQEGTRLDFAFIDGMHTFDYALMDFFYIDLMLRPGGIVAFDDADIPAVRRAVRYAITNRSYRVHACLESGVERSRIGRAAERAAKLAMLRRFATPDLGVPDQELGVTQSSRCVALIKTGDDERAWDFHEEF